MLSMCLAPNTKRYVSDKVIFLFVTKMTIIIMADYFQAGILMIKFCKETPKNSVTTRFLNIHNINELFRSRNLKYLIKIL